MGLGFGLSFRRRVGGLSSFWGPRSGLEVLEERGARLYRDDLPTVLPDVVEDGGDELAALCVVGLGPSELREVFEERLGAVKVRRCQGREGLEFLSGSSAANDVLGAGEIAEDIEVLQG
jgi:hypothetical protein